MVRYPLIGSFCHIDRKAERLVLNQAALIFLLAEKSAGVYSGERQLRTNIEEWQLVSLCTEDQFGFCKSVQGTR